MAAEKLATSSSEDDWRARNDHDTLMRACEVLGDKLRMRGVMREHRRKEMAEKGMERLLARHRSGRLSFKHY